MKQAIPLLLGLGLRRASGRGRYRNAQRSRLFSGRQNLCLRRTRHQDGSGISRSQTGSISIRAQTNLRPGTPIRVRIDDEAAAKRPRAPRQQLKARQLSQHKLAANPGYLAGFNAVTELVGRPLFDDRQSAPGRSANR
jgi:hypothetical protein